MFCGHEASSSHSKSNGLSTQNSWPCMYCMLDECKCVERVILAYIPFQVGGGEGQECSAPDIPASTGQKRSLVGTQSGDFLNQNLFFNLWQLMLTSSSQDIRLRLSKYGIKTFCVFLKRFLSSCSSIVSHHDESVQSLLHSDFLLDSYSCLSVHFNQLN